MSRSRVALVTGPIGAGKTTVAARVVGLAQRQGLVCGGLLAPAIETQCGQKAGIWGVDVQTEERRALARTDRDLGGRAVGPYSFDGAVLEWAVELLRRAMGACDLLIVDEIGKLELWQDAGLAPLLPALAGGEAARVLVIVRDSLLAELQQRLGSVAQATFLVSGETREALPERVLKWLTQDPKGLRAPSVIGE